MLSGGVCVTNRCTTTPSMPCSCIQSKCLSTVCWSCSLYKQACEPSGCVKPGTGYLFVYSLTSGHISNVKSSAFVLGGVCQSRFQWSHSAPPSPPARNQP